MLALLEAGLASSYQGSGRESGVLDSRAALLSAMGACVELTNPRTAAYFAGTMAGPLAAGKSALAEGNEDMAKACVCLFEFLVYGMRAARDMVESMTRDDG